MNDASAQATWALHFIAALESAGVTRAVVSPGSRSTPLVWALSRSELSLMTIIDERVAGFIALGASRADERATLLVCTSGTAGAHYYPAIIEAQATGVPLLVCTADRPPELQGNGSSQTINQTRLFGEFAAYIDLGRPSADPAALAGLRRTARQAAAAMSTGPVHINAPFAKPLEPPADWIAPVLPQPPIAALPRKARTIDAEEAASWLAPLQGCQRLTIVCGPQRVGAGIFANTLRDLADALGAVLLAESASQWGAGSEARGIAAIDDYLADPANEPDGVLQLGPAPVSSAWSRWLAKSEVPHVVVCERGYLDAQNTACLVHSGDALNATLPALLAAAHQDIQKNFVTERARYRRSALSASSKDAGRIAALTIPGVAAIAAAVSALPTDCQLLIGNSMAIRDLDAASLACAAAGPVLSQRGAAGIDGLISGALGARWANGRPTCVVLGDVSAAHDLGGLAALVQSGQHVVIVVIDNGGGRIFERLPVATNPHTSNQLTEHWTTPVSWPLGEVASALGARVLSCEAASDDVAAATRRAVSMNGAVLLHITVNADEDRAARDASRR